MKNYVNKELLEETLELKRQKNALVLAHYYVPSETQAAADFVCDSFEMAKRARSADKDLVVICGVSFMGESAKILSPQKKVLLPVPEATCPMADMVSPEQIADYRKLHPEAAVVCYVNSTAAVKAVSDICCTSASAEKVVGSLDNKEIVFVPDQHLGSYVAEKFPDKTFYLHKGFCPRHHAVTEADVLKAKEAHPDCALAVHPECRTEVVKHADFVGSTSGIIDFAKRTDAPGVIICTENEITEILRRELPEKEIWPVKRSFICQNMKKVTLEALRDCLKYERYEVTLSDEEIAAAKAALDKMVSV